jgi:hypothetical protein
MKLPPKISLVMMSFYVLFSCTKTNDLPPKTVKVTVLEYNGNLPVPGATIDFLKNTVFDFWTCGCYLTEKFQTCTTDESGSCSITLSANAPDIASIQFSKTNYYPAVVIPGQNLVHATGQVVFHFTEAHTHQAKFRMNLFGGNDPTSTSFISTILFPRDTTVITWTGYGNETNTFKWDILDSIAPTILESGGPVQKLINKTGVTTVDIQY